MRRHIRRFSKGERREIDRMLAAGFTLTMAPVRRAK